MGAADESLLQTAYKRLFTHEDTLHFHKTLGILCFFHFIYRFAMVGPSDMAFGDSIETLAWIIIHAFLSVSSLIFRIPKKRILEGSRIWPEYRLHSIAFACRSLACMLLIWIEQRNHTSPHYIWNTVIVIGTIVAADLGTWWVGEHSRSSTINDLKAPQSMKYFFSVMQFHATMNCLVGVRKYSTQFVYVWIIQFTAFLLTLRRKNLLPHFASVIVYGFMLSFGFLVNMYELLGFNSFLMVNTLANLAAFLRIGCRVPKYLLWTIMAVFVYYGRMTTSLVEAGPFWSGLSKYWTILYGVSVFLVVALGFWKVRYGVRYSSVSVAKKAGRLNGHSHSNENGHTNGTYTNGHADNAAERVKKE